MATHLGNSLVQVKAFNDIPPYVRESLEVGASAHKRAQNTIFKRIGVGTALWVIGDEIVLPEEIDYNGLNFIEGFNIEHDMPQLAICGEQCAITVAVQAGYKNACVGITIVAQRLQEPRNNIILPCDMCRPRLRQVATWSGTGDDFQIVSALPNYRRSLILLTSLGTLLEDSRLRYSPEGIDIRTLIV